MKQSKKLFILSLILLLVICTSGYFPKTALSAGSLISQWTFNGDANDSIDGNNGTLHNSASVSNNYLQLTSSSSDYVSVADNDNLSFYDGVSADLPFSIAAWVKKSTGNSLEILSKGLVANTDLEYDLNFNGSQAINFRLMDLAGPGDQIGKAYIIGNELPASDLNDKWLHVVITYDGSAASSGIKIYTNGALASGANVSGTDTSYTHSFNEDGDFYVGRTTFGYADGSIDDLRIYDDALSAGEVNILFNSEVSNYRSTSEKVTFLNSSSSNISDLNTAVATTTIAFTPLLEVNTNDGIQINFASDFDIASVVNGDVAVNQIKHSTDITKGAASVSLQNLQIPITTQGDMPVEQITVAIANSHITSPTVANTYTITVTTWDLGADNAFGGVGGNADTLEGTSAAAAVFGDYNVEITATVEPTLTLTLADWYDDDGGAGGVVGTAGNCNLDTLSSTGIRMCVYSVTVDTNGAGGYTAFVRDTGDFASGANAMADVSGGTMSPGTEAYGVVTSKSGKDISQINDFDGGGVWVTDFQWLWSHRTQAGVNASAVTISDQSFSGATGPVDNDAAILAHMSEISGTTKAGTYSATTIITVVGNF